MARGHLLLRTHFHALLLPLPLLLLLLPLLTGPLHLRWRVHRSRRLRRDQLNVGSTNNRKSFTVSNAIANLVRQLD